MPAKRLYFDDSYIHTFTARVTQYATYKGHPAVALDRSAFYPEGGGQPGDRGVLNDVPVLDTLADDDGEVWHLLAAPLHAAEVRGMIDWRRRFDLMQQHHGQHLVIAACEHLFDAKTVGTHLGTETCTIDVDYPSFTVEQIAALEDAVNQIIWANVPIVARFIGHEELHSLPLRKPPEDYGRIRVVSVSDFDHSPCGGTHPRLTAEVGSVLIRRWERYKNGTRLEFVCGGRAMRDYRWKNRMLYDLAADLSVGLPEMPAAIERLRTAEATQRKALERAQERLLDCDAQVLISAAETINDLPVVVQAYDDRPLDMLRALARRITDAGGVALLGGRGDKAQLVFSRPTQTEADMGALLKVAATVVGGRGGGRPESAQGGGPDRERLDEALQVAFTQLKQSLSR